MSKPLNYRFVSGDILESNCKTIVIPVNCVGVMGAGLAKQARKKFPAISELFIRYCRDGNMLPGSCFRAGFTEQIGGDYCGVLMYKHTDIIFVATKNHWKKPSRIEWIKDCVESIKEVARLEYNKGKTFAIPALGCGKKTGQLKWKLVKPLLIKLAESCPSCSFDFYLPEE